MTDKNPRVYLDDILSYCRKIRSFCDGLDYESFNSDEMRQLSVIRCLEVIGEAAKHISADIKTAYPEVAWKTIAGMRDYLIHDYMGVNNYMVWKTAEEDIPPLIVSIERILSEI